MKKTINIVKLKTNWGEVIFQISNIRVISKIPKFLLVIPRKIAIEKAANLAKSDSIIAILGKGHENYYLIQGQKYHFDDFEEISRF